MRGILALLFLIFIGAGVYLGFAPIAIKPEAWEPPSIPPLTGPYAPNTAMMDKVQRFFPKLGKGPEDVAVKDGFAYTGLEDGRIMKLALDGSSNAVFAQTGGRPLGLQFDAAGNLIVADANKGLLIIAPDGAISVLTNSVAGKKMIFVDDLDIAADGTIWFTDASQRFGIAEFLNDGWEGSATGRLLTYNPGTKETKVIVENLRFANGVAIAQDQSFVLVNETFARRIRKHWLTGVQAGRTEILVNGLPGFPDNISTAPNGLFWVAMPNPANEEFDKLMPQPFMRAVIFRLTNLNILPPPIPPARGWVIAIDGDGKVIHNLMDPRGEKYHTITSVNEFNGELFFGSIAQDSLGRMSAPN